MLYRHFQSKSVQEKRKANHLKFKSMLFILNLLLFTVLSNAQSISRSNLPEDFKSSIPSKLKGGLTLIVIENRCNGCQPWRYINYYSNNSREPIKKEKVTVKIGYRGMYAYPKTHYFSNTKIEQSISGEYINDKKVVIDALKHEYNRKKRHIYDYLKQNPSLKEKMAPFKAKNKDYIELEENVYNGYEYILYTENVIGLTGNTISQIHIFVPEKEIIITAYLLRQEKNKFSTIDEFLKLQADFIKSYIDFLLKNKTQH